MAPRSPKIQNISLSPFLWSKGACKAGKHEKSRAKKVHQMMPRAPNDALGRIDTSLSTWTGGRGGGGGSSGRWQPTRSAVRPRSQCYGRANKMDR